MKKGFAVAVMGLAIGLALAGPAYAAYPPQAPGAEVSTASLHPGDSVTVSGSNWLAESSVDFTLHSSTATSLGTSPVGEDGSFTATLQIPVSVQIGPHELEVSGLDSKGNPQSVALDLSVLSVESATSESDGKASTLSIGLIVLAAVVVISGAAVMATRRKKAHAGAGKSGK